MSGLGVLNGLFGGGLGGGTAMSSAGPVASHPVISPYAPVQVSVTGINMGEILRELNEAPPENGGYGIPNGTGGSMFSRMPQQTAGGDTLAGTAFSVGAVAPNAQTLARRRFALIAGAGVVGVLALWWIAR